MITKKCLICNKKFNTVYPQRKYCSSECAHVKHLQDADKNNKCRQKHYSKICPICGNKFQTTKSNVVYCSRQCFQKTRKKEKLIDCPQCGKTFIKHGPQKFCSKKCKTIFNLPQTRIQKRNWARNKLQNDPNFRLRCNISSRLSHALSNGHKSLKTMELLGCSLEEFWQHLESQFQPGMTRENYGKWHVDHIKPCISFDLTKISQQKECFHYTNLQPLWAEENLKKGSKIVI